MLTLLQMDALVFKNAFKLCFPYPNVKTGLSTEYRQVGRHSAFPINEIQTHCSMKQRTDLRQLTLERVIK